MKIYITTCSADKSEDPLLLPALERYQSGRIRAVLAMASAEGMPCYILSGKYGLLTPQTGIPWYDHVLAPNEIPAMMEKVSTTLAEIGAVSVKLFACDPETRPTWRPYIATIERSCRALEIPFELDLNYCDEA